MAEKRTFKRGLILHLALSVGEDIKQAFKYTVELINVQVLAVVMATLRGTSDSLLMPVICSLTLWAAQCQTVLPRHVWQAILYDLSCKNLLCHIPAYHVNYLHTERVKTKRK